MRLATLRIGNDIVSLDSNVRGFKCPTNLTLQREMNEFAAKLSVGSWPDPVVHKVERTAQQFKAEIVFLHRIPDEELEPVDGRIY